MDVPSDEGDTDQDGGEKVGQLEVELEPWLTGGLHSTRQARERLSNEAFNSIKQIIPVSNGN